MNELTPERAARHYRYGSVKTPFARPEQHYDRPLGELVRKAAIWRRWCLSLLGVGVLLMLLLVLIAALPQQQVFFAGVTPQQGQLRVFGQLQQVKAFAKGTPMTTKQGEIK